MCILDILFFCLDNGAICVVLATDGQVVQDINCIGTLDILLILFEQVSQMEKSGALGVVVVATDGQTVQDMNCDGTECQNQLSIPATFVEYSGQILQ